MTHTKLTRITLASALAALTIGFAAPAEARTCKRINKTEGAILGGVGGAVLGNVILGGTGGTLAGAAVGGVAGHEIARKKYNRNCRRYYRR